MAPPLSRRFLLRAAALAAAAPAISHTATDRAAAAVQEAQAVTAVPTAWSVQPFALDDVALRPGLFADKRQLMLDHARGYDVNRLLQVFRANVGLATGGAVAPGDAPPLTWTSAVEQGRLRHFCDRCSREHLRAMEGKLDSEHW